MFYFIRCLILGLFFVVPSWGFTQHGARKPGDATGFLIHHRGHGRRVEQPVNLREENSLSFKRKNCIIILKVS